MSLGNALAGIAVDAGILGGAWVAGEGADAARLTTKPAQVQPQFAVTSAGTTTIDKTVKLVVSVE